jgi:hypothetical protein
MMEAARTSETLVNFYQTTRRYNPEDSHLLNSTETSIKTHWEVYIEIQERFKHFMKKIAYTPLIFPRKFS